VPGDVLDLNTLHSAMAGVRAASCLIHSMRDGADVHHRDLLAAHNFGVAAREARLQHISYWKLIRWKPPGVTRWSAAKGPGLR